MPKTRGVFGRACRRLMFALATASLATAALTTGGLSSASAAEPTLARPAFKSPFSCGEVWHARTYRGHPSHSVDWNMTGGSNADFGKPVLAGAPGIAFIETHRQYGNKVTIVHGNGWTTLYAHLSKFAVTNAQPVTAQTVVGFVGNTGRSDGSHLHHEQLLGGVRQPVVIDDVAVRASRSSRGASYQSANCPPPKPTRPWWARARR